MLTRKDFQAIADAFQNTPASETMFPGQSGAQKGYRVGLLRAALALADELARANPRFDRARFLTACGYKDAL